MTYTRVKLTTEEVLQLRIQHLRRSLELIDSNHEDPCWHTCEAHIALEGDDRYAGNSSLARLVEDK